MKRSFQRALSASRFRGMQHKYVTRSIVLARNPIKETGITVTLLTEELGLVRARAEGLRRSGAKLAHALQTLSESEVTLLRGKEGWRLSGAVLLTPWFSVLSSNARLRAGKRASLITRLVQGEEIDATLFTIYHTFLTRLGETPEEEHDSAELVATLESLAALGHDAGPIPSVEAVRVLTKEERQALITRINRSLEASGL